MHRAMQIQHKIDSISVVNNFKCKIKYEINYLKHKLTTAKTQFCLHENAFEKQWTSKNPFLMYNFETEGLRKSLSSSVFLFIPFLLILKYNKIVNV